MLGLPATCPCAEVMWWGEGAEGRQVRGDGDEG